MANIELGLLETEKQLSSMIEAGGKTVPMAGERANIVDHLDYIIELLGTMVTDETFKAVKKKMADGYNAINDRIEIVNYLLASGEISGDIDIEPLTITENGEYLPGAGKAYGRVVVDTPEDKVPELLAREFTTFEHSTAKKIGNDAFNGCSSLTSVSFPECTTIGSKAFALCVSLTTASFPKCTTIGVYAFNGCSSLTSVSFPECTTIGRNAFAWCVSLTTASFPKCTTIGNAAFQTCSSLTTASFPECTTIGNAAFQTCSSLTTASFPECTTIESSAFEGCTRLTSLYLLNSSVCNLVHLNAFATTPQYGSIFVPASLVDSYKVASNWSYFSDRIVAFEG